MLGSHLRIPQWMTCKMGASSDLAERLASIREKAASVDTTCYSEGDKKPFPLSTFLILYHKANHECYIDYMEGAKALHSWLTNEGKLPLDLEEDKYPRLKREDFKHSSLLGCYAIQEMSL